MSANDATTATRGTTKPLGIDATPESAGMPHEMTLTFVFDEHGDLATIKRIKDGKAQELQNVPISEKLRKHEGVILKAVIPMTLMMHTNLDGTQAVCCIPTTGGWRYINC